MSLQEARFAFWCRQAGRAVPVVGSCKLQSLGWYCTVRKEHVLRIIEDKVLGPYGTLQKEDSPGGLALAGRLDA